MTTSRTSKVAGSARLTRREVEVMALVSAGYPSKEIADKLFVSKRTIDYHIGGVLSKLGVPNRLQALLAIHSLGLLPFEPGFLPGPGVGMADMKEQD